MKKTLLIFIVPIIIFCLAMAIKITKTETYYVNSLGDQTCPITEQLRILEKNPPTKADTLDFENYIPISCVNSTLYFILMYSLIPVFSLCFLIVFTHGAIIIYKQYIYKKIIIFRLVYDIIFSIVFLLNLALIIISSLFVKIIFFTNEPTLTAPANTPYNLSQFDFDAIQRNYFLVIKEYKPHQYQFIMIQKDCNGISGGPRVVSDKLDLTRFVNKAINPTEYSKSIVNNELEITLKQAEIDKLFYDKIISSKTPQCNFILERTGLK